jgi:hypothetical protein
MIDPFDTVCILVGHERSGQAKHLAHRGRATALGTNTRTARISTDIDDAGMLDFLEINTAKLSDGGLQLSGFYTSALASTPPPPLPLYYDCALDSFRHILNEFLGGVCMYDPTTVFFWARRTAVNPYYLLVNIMQQLFVASFMFAILWQVN